MIDKSSILDNLEILSFPRLSGTKDEKKAFQILKEKIEYLGLKTYSQEFRFSTFYSRTYPKMGVLFTFWLFLVLVADIDFIFTLINIILIGFLFLILFLITRKPEHITLKHVFGSQNLFTILRPKSVSSNNIGELENTLKREKTIVFQSHIDSKGQNLSIQARIISFKVWSYSILSLIVLLILDSIFLVEFIIILEVIALCFYLLSTVFILINITTNKSKGAIDNASGMVILLELLKYYSKIDNRLNQYNIIFLFTGAEETGTMGIRHFYNMIKIYEKRNFIIFNFDAIGKDLEAFSRTSIKKKNNQFYELFFEETKKFGINLTLKRFSFGTHSDGIFMIGNKKYLGIGFGDIIAYQYVHSINDTIDKIDIKGLENLCNLLTNFIKKVDTNNSIIQW